MSFGSWIFFGYNCLAIKNSLLKESDRQIQVDIQTQTDRQKDTYHDQGEPLSNVGGLFVESLPSLLLVIVVKSERCQPLTYGPGNTGDSTSSTS